MSCSPAPVRSVTWDLEPTFDVVVGKRSAQKRFTVHTSRFTERSEFLKAARKPEWLNGDFRKPVDLEDEDPDVFNAYLNFVYFGPDTLKEHGIKFLKEAVNRTQTEPSAVLLVGLTYRSASASEISNMFVNLYCRPERVHVVVGFPHGSFAYAYFETADDSSRALENGKEDEDEWPMFFTSDVGDLVDEGYQALTLLYLLADRLQDLTTTNLVADEVVKFSALVGVPPSRAQVCIAYNSTVAGSPLRALFSNLWMCASGRESLQRLREPGYPLEFLQDIATKLLQAKLDMRAELNDYVIDDDHFSLEYGVFSSTYELQSSQCIYHQHDAKNPKCYTPKMGKKKAVKKG